MKSQFTSLFFLLLLASPAWPSDGDTSAAILDELRKLNENVSRLEQRVAQQEEQIVRYSVEEITASREASGQDSSGLVQRVVEAVKLNEQQTNFPWLDDDLWSRVEKGMSADEVVALLGEPTVEEPSLHKRVDTVFSYIGRRAMGNEKVVGKIKLYRGKVVEVEAP